MSYVVPSGARMEIKFEAEESRLREMLHWLRLHRGGFFEPYPERIVNNVYFDSPDYLAVSENLAGISARTKVRVRWYGNGSTGLPGVLELKRKRNGFGWKLRYDLEIPRCEHGVPWRWLRRELTQQLPAEGKHWLDVNPQPCLINSYRRRYFVSRDDGVRVTIDTDQKVWDQRFKPHVNLLHDAHLNSKMVVEVKFDRADHAAASELIQGLPIRVSRHSKYLNGAAASRL